MSQLKKYYDETVVPKLMETYQYKNIMQVPRIEKVVLNMGLGEAIHNIKILDSAVEELMMIAGQRPVITRVKKIHCRLQTTSRDAHRLHGDTTSPEDV